MLTPVSATPICTGQHTRVSNRVRRACSAHPTRAALLCQQQAAVSISQPKKERSNHGMHARQMREILPSATHLQGALHRRGAAVARQ